MYNDTYTEWSVFYFYKGKVWRYSREETVEDALQCVEWLRKKGYKAFAECDPCEKYEDW